MEDNKNESKNDSESQKERKKIIGKENERDRQRE